MVLNCPLKGDFCTTEEVIRPLQFSLEIGDLLCQGGFCGAPLKFCLLMVVEIVFLGDC
ncbi:hypothetical protein Bealeia2_02065 (plasmid) [Candidatus Bealeia paramacronuclearis]|nr:hypothetical protein [Candidatus Bealeia paramacronuclearis]